MHIELIDLDDVGAVPGRVGSKAARLADARRRGLPVLPGFVVPPAPGRALLEELLPQVAERGPYAVSLALMERAPAEIDLSAAIERGRRLASSLVARSSSRVEDDAVWSGAFSSYLDLGPDQLTTAVAGCWASTVTRTVLEICERTGAEPPAVCPAVLVQPMVNPQAGGTATFTRIDRSPGAAGAGERIGDGVVEIVAVRGSPAPLVAGWSYGWRATVVGEEVTGPAVGDAPTNQGRRLDIPFPKDWFRAVADLARTALDGSPAVIEWAIVEERPVLLQARPAAVAVAGAQGPPAEPAIARALVAAAPRKVAEGDALAGTVGAARAIARFGGPLGDELVLPWLLGRATAAVELSLAQCHLDFDSAVGSARELVADAMGTEPHDAAHKAEDLLVQLERGDFTVLSGVRPVDDGSAAAVLAALGSASRFLVEAGALAHPEQLWSLSVEEVRRLLADPSPGDWHRHRHRALRWQALLQRVIAVRGRRIAGEGVSPGLAAGPARRLSAGQDLRRVVPGDVLLLQRPDPKLAPALWVAAGLVAESGSGAAHLLEVARSLRVPAVVGVDSLEVEDGEDLVLVDGDSGWISVLVE